VPLFLQIILGIAAPVIAAAGVFVSWQQWLNGKRSLKHDLFDRRWKVYAATNDVLVSHINGDQEEAAAALATFLRCKMDAAFLFTDVVNGFLAIVLDAVSENRAVRRGLRSNADETAKLAETEGNLTRLLGEVVTVFREPLDLTERPLRSLISLRRDDWIRKLPGQK
jgi:hypothetical protein